MSLAKVAGADFSRAFLNQVELNKSRPSVRVLRVIADRLGTPVDYLLDGSTPSLDREIALEKARLELARGDLRRCLSVIEPALDAREWPLGVDARLCAGEAMLGLGRGEEATRLLEEQRSRHRRPRRRLPAAAARRHPRRRHPPARCRGPRPAGRRPAAGRRGRGRPGALPGRPDPPRRLGRLQPGREGEGRGRRDLGRRDLEDDLGVSREHDVARVAGVGLAVDEHDQLLVLGQHRRTDLGAAERLPPDVEDVAQRELAGRRSLWAPRCG